jgi:putative colanic acid biosynthesis UDP-glucose lipid carrier transferase
MKTRYLFLIHFVMGAIDLAIVNIAFLTVINLLGYENGRIDMGLMLSANYLWLLAALLSGLYTSRSIHRIDNIYRLTVKSFNVFSVLFLSSMTLSKTYQFSFSFVFLFYLAVLVALILSRVLGAAFERTLKRNFKITRAVAVIGLNSMGLRLAGFFQNTDNHFSFQGFLNQEDNSILDDGGEVLETVREQIIIAANSGIRDVYVSLSPERIAEYNKLQEEADKYCLRLRLVPDMSNSTVNSLKLSYMGDFAVLSNRNEPLEEMENRFKKRVFDILFSSLVIVFVLSWLYPLIGILIKLESRGPVMFKQLRSGRDNESFLCFKFRSMRPNNQTDVQATKNDSRVTKIGAFLRRTSLDELPQFFNVLLGDMSVVGPRPHPLNMTKQYSQIIDKYMVRHLLKSGITGWAQVNGFRGETQDPALMEQRVKHDIWYLENWSMWLELKIIYKTVYNVIKGEANAY